MRLPSYFTQTTHAAPLALFRFFFGIMMFVSIVRFWANGWIDTLYIQPKFFFSYYGFSFVKPFGTYTYVLFIVCALAALLVAVGFYYRYAILIFFLSFTYIELMDKSTYLNHYYFVSILSFLLLFLPASSYFSFDVRRNPKLAFAYIPKWTIDSIKLLICIVYFYAGLAKLNSDWLLEAMPLALWLPAKFDLPILGSFLHERWAHYVFSWGGALYDLSIPFLLLYKPTRKLAFVLVVVFHVLTRVLFPIGMFPYIMIVNALIFFDTHWHQRWINRISRWFRISWSSIIEGKVLSTTKMRGYQWRLAVVALFFGIQFILPFRYLAYPGELFWTEEGYRFSWRVMLMEKVGHASFKIKDRDSGDSFYVDTSSFLNAFQEKQMATQPDFILEFAHFLEEYYQEQGMAQPAVFVDSYVTLNGRPSQPFIRPDVDLTELKDTFAPKQWILPFHDTIKGL